MFRRLRNRLKYEIERYILYRLLHQLLLIAIVIGLIAVVGGLAVWWLTDDFKSIPESIWWSFLRLTDPGYIGDDEGSVKRTISTIISVMGYVFFLGALVAVMTQGLNQSITRLQRGLTPIAQNNHILILGWTNRTPIIIKQLLLSETRVRNFLRRLGTSRLHIVVMAEEVKPEMMLDLRTFLGSYWSGRRITLRSGTPLRIEHLERVDFLHASVIILPGGEYGEETLEYPDGRALKTLLSIRNSGTLSLENDQEMPRMVAEIRDHRKGEIARSAYGGPIETLESDLFIGRLIAQIIRVPGLSHIYYELLTHEEGNEIYLREYPQLVGKRLAEAIPLLPNAIILGVYRNDARRFYSFIASANDPLQPGERLVLIAPGADAHDLLSFQPTGVDPKNEVKIPSRCYSLAPRNDVRRILLLGWNYSIPALLDILNNTSDEKYEIVSMALIPGQERLARLTRRGVATENLDLKFVQGEFTSTSEVETLKPWEFDNVVICASEWMETGGESDARTVLGFLVLDQLLTDKPKRPNVLAQLMNEMNSVLFPEDRCETFTSPVVLSHLLSEIALQHDLRGVFDELFGPAGAEILFRSTPELQLVGQETTFQQIEEQALSRGEIAIGLRIANNIGVNGGIVVNPKRDGKWSLTEADEVIILVDVNEED
ncbi:MAG: hypothetical protein KDD67_03810 [Ignavibacteriae bacterium]|nr:hypothetical protein [Ignavibacteriota bacterium]MCB9215032.1 hypothetical protein [Ignavibacteria bacterium]